LDNSSADKFRTGFTRFALGLSGLVVADSPMRVFSWFNIRESKATRSISSNFRGNR
jgi:hypothetical protein